ncbi:MAG TPA: hypothetical protein VGH98_04365 [Gemmatimonadaceae bacterium]|jgi:hypothetical protein
MLRICRLSISAGIILLAPTSSFAQITGTSTGAAIFAPVDASALGVTRGASMALGVGGSLLMGAGGVGFAGGALRGFLSSNFEHSPSLDIGAAFSRTFVRQQLLSGVQTSIGGQAVAGYLHEGYPRNAAALNLTIPLALTLGDGNGAASLAVYAAPYGEVGMLHRYNFVRCTSSPTCPYFRVRGMGAVASSGLGAGTRMSVGRFAIELMVRDFVGREFRRQYGGEGELALTYRLGK